MALARARPASSAIVHAARLQAQQQSGAAARLACFSTSVPRAATPAGVSPTQLRVNRPPRWDEEEESTMDKASKYFLMTEIFRGMYVVLEQFFRPP